MSAQNPIQKAGCIVLQKQEGRLQVLLVFRKKFNDLSFPKGSIESGETSEQAAVREVFEETGIHVEIKTTLSDQVYEVKGDWVKEETWASIAMFAGIAKGGSFEERTEENEFPEWVDIDEVVERLSYQNLKDYFNENKAKILNLV
ncbi:MAG: NUDIX domain-containing protein [Patescibacteria group bacterium]